MSRYRRLRGMARHVLPRIRQNGMPEGRALMRYIDLPDGVKGYCRWCGLPVERPGKRLWDDDCQRQMNAAIGKPMNPTPWYAAKCVECGIDRKSAPWDLKFDVEHRHPIFIARSQDVKALIDAYMLENLRWMCRNCHKLKSAEEVRWASEERRAALYGRQLKIL